MAKPPQGPDTSALLGAAWGLGWRITAALLIGYYIDDRLSTAPLLTLLLAVAAMVSGVMQILRLIANNNAGNDQGPPRSR